MHSSARATRAPLEQVVLATDFSDGAANAAARTVELPLARAARVCLVHVLPRGLPRKVRASTEERARGALESARDAMRDALSHNGRGGVELEAELVSGDAHLEIIRRARAARADLVVIGRHGERAVRDLFIGSTAVRVARGSGLSTLVVNSPATGPYRRPLVAVELESTPETIVDLALRIAPDATRFSLVHAYQVPFEGFLTSANLASEYRKEYRRAASTRLEKVVGALHDARTRPGLRRGDPRTVILFEAERLHADLVVVGTHGRSGVAHALLGSVAEWVIAVAKSDVLVARPTT